MCVCFTRKFKIIEAEPPSEVKEAFKKYSGDQGYMTAEKLKEFMIEVQGEIGVTIEDAEAVVDVVLHRRHHLVKLKRRSYFTLDDFYHYLFSADLNSPIGSQVIENLSL